MKRCRKVRSSIPLSQKMKTKRQQFLNSYLKGAYWLDSTYTRHKIKRLESSRSLMVVTCQARIKAISLNSRSRWSQKGFRVVDSTESSRNLTCLKIPDCLQSQIGHKSLVRQHRTAMSTPSCNHLNSLWLAQFTHWRIHRKRINICRLRKYLRKRTISRVQTVSEQAIWTAKIVVVVMI